jgi:predicted DsbA family dithiol-disulfide isomerase
MTNHETTHKVHFLFDPICPWAYQASLWIREVTIVRPVKIEWGLLSLEFINRDKKDDKYLAPLRRYRRTFRLLERARQIGGNQALDILYLILGEARHERNRSLNDQKMLANALTAAGLPLSLIEETRVDPDLDEQLDRAYAEDVSKGAFGVPTIYLDDSQLPFYGPLIEVVPTGEEAGQLWDHISGLISLPYFFELKRGRTK